MGRPATYPSTTLVGALVLIGLAFQACTGPAPSGSPESARPPSAGAAAFPDAEPTAPAHTQPLAIVVHHSRPGPQLSERRARRLLSGDVTSWAGLGQEPGAIRLLAARHTDVAGTAEVLDGPGVISAVARDRSAVGVVPAEHLGPQVRAAHVAGFHPARDPEDYPLQLPAAQAPPHAVTMTVVGDIMLGRGVARAGRGSSHPAPALQPMQDRLAAADVTVGNLESTLSRAGAPTQGGDSFAAEPGVVAGLVRAGFDVLGLANNHLGDFGPRALVETVLQLRTRGIATFGAGVDARQAWKPAVVERSGIRFGFLGFNAIGETPAAGPDTPGAVAVSMPPRTGPLDRGELDRFLAAVRRLDRRVDVVVVLPHWGTQYTHRPEPVQHRVARELVAAGADLVVGGHPHWVQGARMVGDALVVHSLGNFVFDMDSMPETMRGLLLETTWWGSELKAVSFVPYAMGAGDFAPRPVAGREAEAILRLFGEYAGPAFRSP